MPSAVKAVPQPSWLVALGIHFAPPSSLVQADFRQQMILILCQRKRGQGIHTVGILPGRPLFENQPPLEREDGDGYSVWAAEREALLQCFWGGRDDGLLNGVSKRHMVWS